MDEKKNICNYAIKGRIMKNRKKYKIFDITKITKNIINNIKKEDKKLIISNTKKINKIKKTEKNNINTKDIQQDCIYPNSLISISKDVFKYLKNNENVNIKALNDIIISKINSTQKKSENLSEKNIQRRVYDAINVMNAIGLIKKEKSNLIFQGFINLNKFGNFKNTTENLLEEIRNKSLEINEKRNQILTIYTKVFIINFFCCYF